MFHVKHGRTMNKIIAVANQKGGVGKTTTAINLSACLAMKNKRTLLIDFDPQGMSTLGLGKPKDHGKGIYQVLMNGKDLMECVIGTELDNFYLCPCSPELSGAELELYPVERREKGSRRPSRRPGAISISSSLTARRPWAS